MLHAGGDIALAGKERVQRFELQIPLRCRVNGDSKWRRGVTKNIGCSGVLSRGEQLAELSSRVEISVVVLNEMIKQKAAEVFCWGAVT